MADYLSDAEVFGSDSGYLTDDEVFGTGAPAEDAGFLASVKRTAGKVADEAGQLRDEFFSGVDNVVAGVKTLNAGMQMRRLQETEAEAKRLEERGQDVYARQLRGEAQSLQERVPVTAGEAAQAQADSQRGSQMATRPQVAKFLGEKTWTGAWEAFKEAPYDVIAGLTATSLPAALPGIAAASAMGVGAGAAVMGGSSAAVEAGSSLGEFARERGVDMTDAKAVQAFFSDRQNLSDAMVYAGKRAGIIGALDAASGGIAGKTIAGPIKGKLARQAVNVPTQMGVQAGLGAAGEAGGQLATKGRIDEPAQVMGEAFGEMGGAPLEVAAFSKEVRDSLRKPSVTDILDAPDVDTAIKTAGEIVSAPVAEAGRQWQAIAPTQPTEDLSSQRSAEEAGQAWQGIAPTAPAEDLAAQQVVEQRASEEAGAQASGATDQRITEVGKQWQDLGITDPATDLQRQRTWGAQNVSIPVADAGAVQPGMDGWSADDGRGESAGGLGDRGRGAASESGSSGGAPMAVGGGDRQPAPVAFRSTLNPTGTLTIQGEPSQIRAMLSEFGITSLAPVKGGVLVGKSQASKAHELLNAPQATTAPAQPVQAPVAALARSTALSDAAPSPEAMATERVAAAQEQGNVAEAARRTVESPSLSDSTAKWTAKTAEYAKSIAPSAERVGEVSDYVLLRDTRPDWNQYDDGRILAVDKAGNVVADVFFGRRDDGKLEAAAEVAPAARRQGIASAIYDQIEHSRGESLDPAKQQTAYSRAFWGKRLRQAASAQKPETISALPTERERVKGMIRASNQRKEKLSPNPLKTFLIRNGIALRLAKEFAPGTKERLAMSKTFRKDGLELDALAERAAEMGYIRSRDDTDELYSLITKVAGGERVAPMYGQDAEAEMAAMVDRQRQLEQDAAEAVGELSDESVLAIEENDDSIPWDTASNVSEAEAMRALGFSEQEISDADAARQDRAQEAGAGNRQPEQTAAGEAQGNRARRDEQARAQDEGLSAPTREDILAQQERAEQAERDERAADKAAQDKASADAQRGEFRLSGSDRAADANPDQTPLFSKGDTPATGITRAQFTAALSEAFGAKVAERLEAAGVVVPLTQQASLPDHVVPFVRDGATVFGYYDPKTDRTYAVLENLSPDMVKGLALHEIGIHFGLSNMLGKEKYANVIARVKVMGKAGNKEVIAARDAAKENAATESQIPEETLARLVQNNPEMGLVREVIAAIKAFLFKTFGIGGKYLTIDDMAALAKAAVKHASRNELEVTQDSEPAFSQSVITGKTLPQTWQAPDASKLDDFIYKIQDKLVDTKRAVQAVRDSIGQIADELDPYLQEELYHGRAAMATKEFLEKQVRPLLVDMQARGVEMSDFEEYLHNRHAERRNVQVAKVNPKMPDGGSGIKTADARAYLSALTATKRQAYEAIAKRIEEINRDTRKLLVSSGLEKQTTIDAWEAAYGDEYVPLMREEMDSGTTGIGQGYSVRGSSSKRAMGSNKPVANIIANIALQREKAITRAQKKRIGEALYGLVLKAPNDDFWFAVDPALHANPSQVVATQLQLISIGLDPADAESIAKEPITRYVGPDGKVHERINPAMRGMDNVLAVRIDGEDKFVFFNQADTRAMRMVTALKNLDADQLGTVMGTVAKMTRYFAAVNTQWNPVFGVTNLTRDVQTALLNLNSTPLKHHKADVMKHILPALRGIYIDLRDHRAGKQPTSAYAALFEEFQREGGATGYRDMYANAEERAEAIAAELRAVKDGKAMKFGKGVFGWLSDYNESMENAVRVATYKVGKEQGLSNQQAASVAKNLTVNFNRKGQVALQAGALYAFFNAAVQGTARMGQTMFEGGKLSSAGKKILAGGILLGSMQALLLAAAGFDEDEPPDFVRERSLVFPIGGSKYIAIPMPLGFHVIPNLGRIPTEWAMGGFKNTPKRIGQLIGLFADAFNPIGSAGLSLQTLTPTIIDPLAALSENRDWTGKPIAKEDFNSLKPTAGHTRAKDSATPWARLISEGVNWATGGTDYKPGLASPTPDQIDYLIGQITGGVGREAGKIAQVATSTVTGEEVPMHKIPLVGRFVGTTEGQAAEASRFYENLREIGQHKVEIDGLKKDRRGAEIASYLREHKEARMVNMAEKVHRQVSELNKRKREMVKNGAPKERVKLIEAQITQRMRALNDRVRKLEED